MRLILSCSSKAGGESTKSVEERVSLIVVFDIEAVIYQRSLTLSDRIPLALSYPRCSPIRYADSTYSATAIIQYSLLTD
jgi:hypothetical protein